MKLHPLAAAAVAALALALPATAAAEGGSAPLSIGFQVKSVDAGKAIGMVHCAPPEVAGRIVTLSAAPGVDLSALTPGAVVGLSLDADKHITAVQPTPPCPVQPVPLPNDNAPKGGPQGGPQGGFGDFPKGQQPQPGQPQGGPGLGAPQGGPQGGDLPRFMPGFANRVWKFSGSADGYDAGKLSITVEKLLNLPKKFNKQDDELVDEDAVVLVSSTVKVFDAKGKRTTASALDDADSVVVQGKLLPPSKWQKDEDGQPVTTIRAKRVAITG